MANILKTTVEHFDWETNEEETTIANSNTYDSKSEFIQGIAIVKKNNKYGAIMIGGKEIIQPIYDELSFFDGGIAKAKYSVKKQGVINTDERRINLSGQIEVVHNNEIIFLPEEYDWGFDYESDICVVIKNGRYGLIDKNFKLLIDCKYASFEGFKNGLGIFWDADEPIIVDQTGSIRFCIHKTLPNGYMCIADINEDKRLLGIMNPSMELITPLSYSNICDLNSRYFVADTNDITGSFSKIIFGLDGSVVKEFVASKILGIENLFIVVYTHGNSIDTKKTFIYDNDFRPLLTTPKVVDITRSEHKKIHFILDNLKYSLTVQGDLFLIEKKVKYGHSDRHYTWESLKQRKVISLYLNYQHQNLCNKYEIILDESYNKGISDLEGNVVIEPQYNYISAVSENIFIVAKSETEDNTLMFGVINNKNQVLIPLQYNYLLPINHNYIAYTPNNKYTASVKNEYNVLDLPTHNSYWQGVYFGILDISGNIITNAIYSNITAIGKDGNTFVVGIHGTRYGLVNAKGDYVLNPCYSNIRYIKEHDYYMTELSGELGSDQYKKLFNYVSVDGFFIVSDNSNIALVSTKIADWCSSFSEDGLATLIKDGVKAHINRNKKIVSLLNNEYVEIPERYNYACDFKCGYVPVQKHDRYGIVNSSFEEIIPFSYSYIEPLTPHLFKFKEGNLWGIVNDHNTIKIQAKYVKIESVADRFVKFTTRKNNNNYQTINCGIFDENLNTVIQANYNNLTTVILEDKVFWIASSTNYGTTIKGLFNENGRLIIPLIFNEISQTNDCFICKIQDCHNHQFSFTYNLKGEQILHINSESELTIPTQYDVAFYANMGIVRVLKDGKWGLIKNNGEELIAPSFSFIDTFVSTFAIVGISDDTKINYTLNDSCYFDNTKYGLIDTTGEIVLRLEYDGIKKWDNSYYLIKKDGLYGVLSPSLNIVVDISKKSIRNLDNRFLILEAGSNRYYTWYHLIDYHGNVVIKENEQYDGFQNIEIIENNLLKVYYHIGHMTGLSAIAFLNERGKTLCKCDECEDIQFIGNGLFLITKFEYTGMDGNGCSIGRSLYNIVDIHNKELFESNYLEIEMQTNSKFHIRDFRGWGLADSLGRIIIEPHYLEKLLFENGLANVKVEGSSRTMKINLSGQIIIKDGENEIIIPSSFYWASMFEDGLSIVRSNDGIGVINKNCCSVIPAKYDCICILSDKTIYIQEHDCYGIYDLNGNCIFPIIFTEIEHIQADRIRVKWNLTIAKEWQKGQYVTGSSKSKYIDFEHDYYLNNRSALCDSQGNILNDNRIIYVSKYKGKFAQAYTEVREEDDRVQFKNVGVIDIDGNIIIPTEYDKIILYDHCFASLRKEGQIGIANLNTKEVFMFDINCKHICSLDCYGRMKYSEDGYYDYETDRWVGETGVLSIHGIIIKPGEYTSFVLLSNGLIEITNEIGQKGLINIHGEIIQYPIFSHISFNGNYGSVCIGGQSGSKYPPYNIIGGKWGIIDIQGKIIKECIYDQEQELPKINFSNNNQENRICFEVPHVIVSDTIPKSSYNNYNDYYYDNYDSYNYDDD